MNRPLKPNSDDALKKNPPLEPTCRERAATAQAVILGCNLRYPSITGAASEIDAAESAIHDRGIETVKPLKPDSDNALVPTPVEPYVQLVHKDCGGQIVAVSRERRLWFACKVCKDVWEITHPLAPFPAQVPDEWAAWK